MLKWWLLQLNGYSFGFWLDRQSCRVISMLGISEPNSLTTNMKKKRAYIESQKQAYKSLHPNKQRPNCSSTSQLRANSRQNEHMANSIKNKPVNNTEITYAASLIKTCTNTVTTLSPNSPSRMKIGWNFNLGGIRIAAVPVKSRVTEKWWSKAAWI